MKIAGTTRLAGIMGWPVAHSRSPVLHGFWLDETGTDGAYVRLPVRPEHIEQAPAVLGSHLPLSAIDGERELHALSIPAAWSVFRP